MLPALSVLALGMLPHVVVYREPGRFGGWPANHGIWSWGNEILVGFSAGFHKNLGPDRHPIDHDKPEEHLLARSLDGGHTWTVERPASLAPPPHQGMAGIPGIAAGKEPVDCPGGIDFLHPDFALTVRMADNHVGPSWFYYSTNRGRTWNGPFRLPDFGQKGIAARTDYLVNGKGDALLFLTAAKSNGREGRPLCVRTTDGGKTWQFVSFLGPEPAGFAIMPASVRLSPARLLAAVRVKQEPRNWIDAYVSDDNGGTWRFLNQPAPSTGGHSGNPPSLIRLRDGRLCLTYGYRSPPYGMRARLSRDNGATWGSEISLRDGAGAWDLGYPRTVQRPDGKIVTIYYFNDDQDKERFIAATIWDPGK